MTDTTLLTFPCEFPIKVMGRADVDLEKLVLKIVQQYASRPEKIRLSSRLSKAGTYLALTIRVEATSQLELDTLYRQLSSHPLVLVAL